MTEMSSDAGKELSSVAASAADNFTAAGSAHSFKKAVLSFTAKLAGLVGTFHGKVLV